MTFWFLSFRHSFPHTFYTQFCFNFSPNFLFVAFIYLSICQFGKLWCGREKGKWREKSKEHFMEKNSLLSMEYENRIKSFWYWNSIFHKRTIKREEKRIIDYYGCIPVVRSYHKKFFFLFSFSLQSVSMNHEYLSFLVERTWQKWN